MSESKQEITTLEHLDLNHPELLQPKYERLKSYLMAEVTSGRLQPGDALPTTRH